MLEHVHWVCWPTPSVPTSPIHLHNPSRIQERLPSSVPYEVGPAVPPPVCYLCGKPVVVRSRDHAVPKTLLEGQPPKMRGFEYGGFLPTHKTCNNEFGPETYAQRSLELIDALHNPDCTRTFRHTEDPTVRLMALNSECLPNFNRRDLRYFKIADCRQHRTLPSVGGLRSAEAVDPFKLALYAALAVLLKSAAALAIRRKIKAVPDAWQVMAVPYVGDAAQIDFDELFGSTRPFSPSVKVWMGVLVTGDVLVVYRTSRVLVYFFFRFSSSMEGWRHMRGQFVGKPRLRFDGRSIRDVLHNGWKPV